MKKLIITGAPRTGTTALAGLLSHSTNVLVTNEVGIYEEYPRRYYNRKSNLLKDSTNARYLQLKGLTEKDIDDFFEGNFENKGNIDFLGDKFPAYCSTLEYCNHLCKKHNDAYFIFTYRNPCATIYSGIKRSKIERDERADWFFVNVKDSVQKLATRTQNWSREIFPNVKNKIIINYDYYINDVDLLIKDLNNFLNTELIIDNPKNLYSHIDPNSYKSEMSKRMLNSINTKTQSLDEEIQALIRGQA